MSNRMNIIKATFDDFIDRGSIDTLMASVTDDVVLKNCIPPPAPFAGEFHGKQGILDYFAQVDTVLAIRSVRATDYFENDEKVVVLGDEVLRIKSTGVEFPSEWCTVFTFRGNLISRLTVIEDHSPLSVALAKCP